MVVRSCISNKNRRIGVPAEAGRIHSWTQLPLDFPVAKPGPGTLPACEGVEPCPESMHASPLPTSNTASSSSLLGLTLLQPITCLPGILWPTQVELRVIHNLATTQPQSLGASPTGVVVMLNSIEGRSLTPPPLWLSVFPGLTPAPGKSGTMVVSDPRWIDGPEGYHGQWYGPWRRERRTTCSGHPAGGPRQFLSRGWVRLKWS